MHRLRNILQDRNTVIIKIGTNLLAEKDRGINIERINSIAKSVSYLRSLGKNVAIVTSGAIGAGVAAMRLSGRPKSIPESQATAAVGQPLLMEAYENAFRKQRLAIAQILLTKDDFISRSRYVNAKNTFAVLFDKGVVPIINENDTVAVEEIKLGDNDNLSAMVATLVEANIMIVLTDIDGLFSDDPALNHDAEMIRIVEKITPEIERFAKRNKNDLSTGGMITKIQAAKRCVKSGIAMIIANGKNPQAIDEIFSGEFRGTVFLPAQKKLSMRKQWIGFVSSTAGTIVVDEGAKSALLKLNKSLLPSGIVKIYGSFNVKDIISILDTDGNEIGKGVTGYSSAELMKIKGKKSADIEAILRRKAPAEVVHRDNLAVIED
ncbi:MAG TPA: glutamate 5-kinase [Candidatus Acidoferrales bacterium]|nr:glutamate 5-kinase [Candidatus Acidoferrales bacterium]